VAGLASVRAAHPADGGARDDRSGPCLLAALRAAEAGRSVVLCDDGPELGGTLLHRAARIDGGDGRTWVEATLARLGQLGAVLLPCTTAFGMYDHGLVALNERRGAPKPDRLWRVRPARLLLATGAIERPLPFANNDLPGILSAEAGLATDQGKTSNLNGLALMAEITGRSIPQVGTTTYRPPFTPVPLASFAGLRGGELMNPPRRLALENDHRDDDAHLREYGGWLRPAWYGDDSEAVAVQREARKARETVALFDGSPLGKIEVQGPQAASFLDFVYYNTMSTLKSGRCRYGFILSESGVVYDGGVLVRLDENRFIVSCSSSHVAGVHAMLEEWRQDRFDRSQLFIHDATAAFATLTVSGPRSKALLETVGLGLSLDDTALPHMATAWGSFGNTPVSVTRVSYTGDRSYEVSIRVDRAAPLWRLIREKGQAFDAVPIGIEALMVLRAEKGFIVIGKDSDGMTRPMDLGVSAPLAKKRTEFIGRRSLFTEEAQRPDRNQLVGLEVVDGGGPLATGAHGVEAASNGRRSLGYVTSSYFSPTLGRPIALGLIERGATRSGDIIDVQHLGQVRRARIVAPCALDPEGVRLNG
jgi:sarcosine oxidase subunit alpha